MKRKTKVRIQRFLFISKLTSGAIGFVVLMCRFQTFRNLVWLFAVSCVITAVWQYAEWKGGS